MAKQTFSIDGLEFEDVVHGVPSELTSGYEVFGSIQRLMQSNGAPPKKIAQVFGVFPNDLLEFEATYLGQNAQGKYRQLVGKMNALTVVQLRDGDEVFNGLLWKIEKTKLNRFRLKMKITFCVLSTSSGNASQSSTGPDPQQTLSQQLASLSAAGADPSFSAANVATAQAAAQAAGVQFSETVAALGAPTSGMSGLLGAFLDSVSSSIAAAAALNPEIAQSTVQLVQLGTVVAGSIATGQTLQAALLGLSDPGALSIYAAVDGYMGNLTSYLATLHSITGEDGKNQQPVVASDLFTLAATQLGDADRFTDLQAVNPGISDPFVVGPALINLPTV